MENQTYTEMEKSVFNAAVDICVDDYSAHVAEIAADTGLTKDQVKGVISSLVKKNRVYVGSENRGGKLFNDVFITHPTCSGGFLCDHLSDEEVEELKIK